MKKLLAIVLCLAMCLGILAMTVTAATTYSVAGAYVAPGTTTEKAGVFGVTWTPGHAANVLTSTGTNTYSITYKNAPAGEYRFKVTDGTWTNSWGNNGGNYIVKLESACDLTINFNSSTKKVTHEAASSAAPDVVTVHAKVPTTWTKVAVYYWGGASNTWPGTVATKDADGWYTVEIPAAATNFIVNNNNGGKQTQDLTLPNAKEVWVVVEGTKGTVHTTNPDSGSQPDPEPEKTITVHAQVPATWTKANAYAWNSSTNANNQAWPGAAMTKGDDGWYTIKVPASANRIIINNGSAQTQDITLPAAEEVWIVVDQSNKGTIYTTKPEAGTQPEIPELKIDSVGIRGDDTKFSAVNWNSDVAMTKTSEEGYGVWEYTFKNVPAGTWPTIKFTTNGNWDVNFGCMDVNQGAVSGTAHQAAFGGMDNNIWFEVKELSDVHIKLDLSNFDPTDNSGATYTITVTAVVTEQPDPTPDPEPKPDPEPTGMIIVHAQVPADWTAANAYTWADGSNGDPAWPGAAMEKGADGWYTLAVPSNVNNIIINNGNGGQTQDIKLTGADEIWITVEASESGFIGTLTESNPNTGDDLIAVCAAMLLAGAAVVTTVASKKRFF